MRPNLKKPIYYCSLLATIVIIWLSIWLIKDDATEDSIPDIRIAVLTPKKSSTPVLEAFEHALADHGYIVGQNLRFITHPLDKALDTALPELLNKKPDLLLTFTTPATKLAKQATSSTGTPILFVMHDPVASGIIESLAHPGGNASGIQVHGSAAKILIWLRTILPNAKNVFVPISFDTMAAQQNFNVVEDAARQLGITLTIANVNTEAELAQTLDKLPANSDAIYLAHSIFIQGHINAISKAALKRKIPLISTHHHPGVTLSYGMDDYQTGLQLARMAHMIITGTPAHDIPTEVANFSLEIDISLMDKIELHIEDSVLIQANKIRR